MNAALYQPMFLLLVGVLALALGLQGLSSEGNSMQAQDGGTNLLLPLFISLLLTFWIGMRPVSHLFGDTVNYAFEYRLMNRGGVTPDWHSEWVWGWLMSACQKLGLSVHWFFTVVEFAYVFTAFWAVKRFMPDNPLLGMVFVWGSLMYFSFGVNGLRNGLACHIVLLALSFLLDDKYVLGALLCLVAFGIHRSTMLPIAAIVVSLLLIRDARYPVYFWIASIFISLVAGGAVTNFFASLGFDDRMTSYTTGDIDMGQFRHTGFRWDFLLYSAAPVLLSWYVCVKRALVDNWYTVICSTYCLSNAFWVMVIRSSFSNRFAYLSWFLYPIVVAYPLVNMQVWDDQDRKTGLILLVYIAFTAFMQLVVW